MTEDLQESEKVRLGRLNSRLEAYIKAVREQKKGVSAEPGKGVRSVIVNEEYESQLTVLRREKQTLKYELEKVEKSSINREEEVKRIRKQLDDALISKLYADKKLELVQDELRLLQETNKEISLLLSQMRMESADAKSKITDLEQKLDDSRRKLEVYLLDRNKLRVSKTSLELEIVTYERLLKAEEERIRIKNENRENTESTATVIENEEQQKTTQITNVSYEREYVTQHSETVTEAIVSQSVAVDSKIAETYSGGYADNGEGGLIAGLGQMSYTAAEDANQQYESADAASYSVVVETSGEANVSVEADESSSSSESGSEAGREEGGEIGLYEKTQKKSRFGGLFSKKK